MKIIFILWLIFFLPHLAAAVTLHHVRFGHYPEKIRAVFDFDGEVDYQAQESRDRIELLFINTKAGPQIPNYFELDDVIVRHFEIEKEAENLKVSIPLREPIDYNIFYLSDPPRLVIDFSREFLNVIYGGLISEGVEVFKVKKGTKRGHVLANVIKVNLDKAEVRPVLARKYKPDVLQSFVRFLLPWQRGKSDEDAFSLDKLTNIVNDHGALAGINGTFFAHSGSPLGALIIDEELVSSPIYDRSAFFIDENKGPFIDNVFVSCYFKLENLTRYKISGINQGRGESDIIMYTPAWGTSTRTNTQGMEIVVEKSKVAKIDVADSKIPIDGYVLSISGPALETLMDYVRVGDKIDARIEVFPYATSPETMIHLVSGGPRLLKHGETYVTKYEERFRADIAKGRAARTALGITQRGEVLLVTVDGPPKKKKSSKNSQASIGVTLEELSQLMLSLGAQEAMNLDGGSSSTMVVDGRVVNRPTGGKQRGISNAIVVHPKI